LSVQGIRSRSIICHSPNPIDRRLCLGATVLLALDEFFYLTGWKASHEIAVDDSGDLGFEPLSASETVEVDADCRKQAWARLLAKIYEVDPFVCPKCGSVMKVIAIIQETEEIRRILAHLVKIGRSPPGFDRISLN